MFCTLEQDEFWCNIFAFLEDITTCNLPNFCDRKNGGMICILYSYQYFFNRVDIYFRFLNTFQARLATYYAVG